MMSYISETDYRRAKAAAEHWYKTSGHPDRDAILSMDAAVKTGDVEEALKIFVSPRWNRGMSDAGQAKRRLLMAECIEIAGSVEA
jgi:hypothetical protein